MNEVIFIIEEAPEGGYTARALEASIFTEADTWSALQEQIQDVVYCHFESEHDLRTVILYHQCKS